MRITASDLQLKYNSTKTTYEKESYTLTYIDRNGQTKISSNNLNASELSLLEKANKIIEKQKEERNKKPTS